MRWEQVPDLALFRDNTAAFVHDLAADSIANVAGESNYVRVQVLTPAGVLDRDEQLGVVSELTEIVAAAAGDPSLAQRTWVLLTESPDGGWESPATRTPALISPSPREQNSQRTPSHRQKQHDRGTTRAGPQARRPPPRRNRGCRSPQLDG